MSAPTTTASLLDFAVRTTLARYRLSRRYRTPFTAACDERDGAARFLADSVLGDGRPSEFAVEAYRVAVAVYDAVCVRANIGSTKFVDLNRQQQFWQTGERTAVTS